MLTTGPEMDPYSTRPSHSSRQLVVVALSSLLVGIIGTWSFSSGMHQHAWTTVPSFQHQHGLAEELNGLVPEFGRHQRVFWNDSDYGPHRYREDLDEHDVKTLLGKWESLIPPDLGYLPVEKPETHTLPPPLRWDIGEDPTPGVSWYSMSVFHQLHCLESILKAFLNDRDKLPWEIPHPMVHDDSHIFHCFDYLRQAVMCYGDTALEGADVYEQATGTDKLSQGTFGIGTSHVCKNFEEIFQYGEGHGLLKSLREVELLKHSRGQAE